MIKIPLMTSGTCREDFVSRCHGADRLEPTRPLTLRDGCPAPVLQFPILRLWF